VPFGPSTPVGRLARPQFAGLAGTSGPVGLRKQAALLVD
jgi:hypothetical protein